MFIFEPRAVQRCVHAQKLTSCLFFIHLFCFLLLSFDCFVLGLLYCFSCYFFHWLFLAKEYSLFSFAFAGSYICTAKVIHLAFVFRRQRCHILVIFTYIVISFKNLVSQIEIDTKLPFGHFFVLLTLALRVGLCAIVFLLYKHVYYNYSNYTISSFLCNPKCFKKWYKFVEHLKIDAKINLNILFMNFVFVLIEKMITYLQHLQLWVIMEFESEYVCEQKWANLLYFITF